MWIQKNVARFIILSLIAELTKTASVDLAQNGQFPYQAAIILRDQVVCGGSILSADWIISAAHCFYLGQESITDTSVSVGDVKWQNGQRYAISYVVIHPEYSESVVGDHDIGLVKTSSKIQFIEGIVQPVPLNGNYFGNSAKVTISSYGSIDPELEKGSNELFYVQMQTVTNEECAEMIYQTPWHVPDYLFCTVPASEQTPMICNGGSGSGVTIDGQLVGIISFVKTGCKPPTGSVRISSYVDWINYEMHKVEQ